MRSSRFSEEIILTFLKEAASGIPIEVVCSTARVSTRTFYRWRAQYGGLTLPAARERNDLLRENARLRVLLREFRRDERRPRDAVLAPGDRPGLSPFRSEIGVGAAPSGTRGACSSGRFASVRGKR